MGGLIYFPLVGEGCLAGESAGAGFASGGKTTWSMSRIDFELPHLLHPPAWPNRAMLVTTRIALAGLLLAVPRGLLAWLPLFAFGTPWTFRRY